MKVAGATLLAVWRAGFLFVELRNSGANQGRGVKINYSIIEKRFLDVLNMKLLISLVVSP